MSFSNNKAPDKLKLPLQHAHRQTETLTHSRTVTGNQLTENGTAFLSALIRTGLFQHTASQRVLECSSETSTSLFIY